MRTRKLLLLLCLVLLLVTGLTACGDKDKSINSIEDMKDLELSFGYPDDIDLQDTIYEVCPKAELRPQNDIMALKAVDAGKLDCFVAGDYLINGFIDENPDLKLKVLDEPLIYFDAGLGLSETCKVDNYEERVNACIAELKEDGTMDDMERRWRKGEDRTMPDIEMPENPDYTLKVATFGQLPTLTYYVDNKLVGFEIELAYRVAAYLGCGIRFEVASFPAMLMGLAEGRYDMIASNLYITNERSENLVFSDSYTSIPMLIAVRDNGEKAAGPVFNTKDDLKNVRTWGNITGTAIDTVTLQYYPDAQFVHYKGIMDALLGLSDYKIDSILFDAPTLKYICAEHSEYKLIPELIADDDYSFLAAKNEHGREIIDEFNEWLAKAKADGTIDELEEFWTGTEPPDGRISPDDLTPTNGTITIGYSPSSRPEAYFYNNEPTGFAIEAALLFCKDRGYGAELLQTDRDIFVYALESGKTDLYVAFNSYSDERAQHVTYSDVVLNGGIGAVVRNENNEKESSFAAIAKSFKNTFIKENRWQMVLSGLGITLLITIGGFILANILGGLFCAMEMSRRRALRITADVYSRIMQGTPIVVLLMILYYVVFAKSPLSGVSVAIIGFGLSTGAILAQLFHGGIDGVDRGQKEASLALGFTDLQTFTGITLPQTIRTILPGWFSALISMMKMTSIVGYIAVIDMTKAGDIIRSSTYEAFFPLIAIAIIYFAITFILLSIMKRIQKKLAPKRRTGTEVEK